MKILVTGGSGFIGTNLLDFYLKLGVEILNLDISSPRNSQHFSFWHKVNILDKDKLIEEVKTFSPTHVFHLAARTDIEGKNIKDYSVNIQGVENIISAISNIRSIQRAIFASSRLVCKIAYQPKDEFDYFPTTLYGESKVLGEKIVRASKDIVCPWVLVRPTSIWGPWFDVPYRDFFLAIAKGSYFHPDGYNVSKSYGFVGNTVFQLHKLLIVPAERISGKTFYLGDYAPANIRNMADRIQETIEARKIKTIPVFILRFLASSGDLFKLLGWRKPPLTSFRLNNLLTDMIYDFSSVRSITGELPYSLDEGIKVTVDWMRRNGDLINLP